MPAGIYGNDYCFHQISRFCCFNVLMYYAVLINGGTYRSLVTPTRSPKALYQINLLNIFYEVSRGPLSDVIEVAASNIHNIGALRSRWRKTQIVEIVAWHALCLRFLGSNPDRIDNFFKRVLNVSLGQVNVVYYQYYN